jgi:hypothetical protein
MNELSFYTPRLGAKNASPVLTFRHGLLTWTRLA